MAFEVGLLDDELEERLVTEIGRRQRLPLGHQAAFVAGPLETMSRASWGELARRAVARREYRFEFVTATTFRSNQMSVPLPLPKSIFGHYRSRWNAFAPPELRLDIATSRYPASRRELIGFTGHVTLSVRAAGREAHSALDALAAIADYAGTGSRTPQGMGVTRYPGGSILAGGRADPEAKSLAGDHEDAD